MALAAGQTLSFYEVLGPLGAGGMGEVYRAKDTRLEREVAIKVLPEEFAGDDERLRRFEREAKTLASLNHPNVAAIHGVDQEGDVCFLALELVPGNDLETRLKRGPLPVDEAIDVCRQIAEGLEAAHEAGVVHRDLKPANVRVTPEGVVKLLDFGLAKPIHAKSTGDGTTTAESDSFLMTEEGLVLGTPTYMSPEQARGKPVDRRTDIWALGCVLFECLTGERAFRGESLTDVLAAIVSEEPDWSRLPPVPARIEELLHRTLTKDPRLRLRDAGEARMQLTLARDERATVAAGTEARSRGPGTVGGVVLLLAVAAAGWGAGLWSGHRPADGLDTSAPLAGRDFHGVLLEFGDETVLRQVTVSPDGTKVAWLDGEGLHVRAFGDPELRTVVADPKLGPHFAWSPDGHDLAYTKDDDVWTTSAGGGTPRRFGDFDGYYWTRLRWTEDGRIAFFTTKAIVALSQEGELTVLFEHGESISHLHGFRLLPDGSGAVIVPHVVGGGTETIEVLRDGKRKELVTTSGEEPELVAFTRDGNLFWSVPGGVWRLPLSTDFEREGDARLVAADCSHPSLANDGTLVYVTARNELTRQLGWIDRKDGTFEPIGPTNPQLWTGALSEDAKQIVFTVPEGKAFVTFILDVERNLATPWIRREDGNALSTFFPDGRIGVFPYTTEEGTFVYPPSGEGEPELIEGRVLTVSRDGEIHVTMFAEDGPTFVSGPGVQGGRRQILSGEHLELFHGLSRDGAWMLYSSMRTGRRQVYLTRFPPVEGEAWPVSGEGGENAWFGNENDEIFFVDGRLVHRVSLRIDPAVRLGTPEALFELPSNITLTDYDGTSRFLSVQTQSGGQKVWVDTDGGN